MTGSPEEPIQIDEACFSGRREHKKGRFLEEYIGMGPGYNRSNNHGDQVIGPWVLCINKSKSDQLLVILPDRKGTTLIPIIQKYDEPGVRLLLTNGLQ